MIDKTSEVKQLEKDLSLAQSKHQKLANPIALEIVKASFSAISALPLSTLLHEYGHSIAADSLYNNADPEIRLRNFGYGGGSCRYFSNKLSSIGEFFGDNGTDLIVSSAGPGIELIAIAMATKSNSIRAKSIAALASIEVLGYCYSYFSKDCTSSTSHDYCSIANSGGPVAITAAIATVSLVTGLCLANFVKSVVTTPKAKELWSSVKSVMELNNKLIQKRKSSAVPAGEPTENALSDTLENLVDFKENGSSESEKFTNESSVFSGENSPAGIAGKS